MAPSRSPPGPGMLRRPLRASPLDPAYLGGLTSLPPTPSVIGTEAAEQEVSQRRPQGASGSGPTHGAKASGEPQRAGPGLPRTPRSQEAPHWQWLDSWGDRTLPKVAQVALGHLP